VESRHVKPIKAARIFIKKVVEFFEENSKLFPYFHCIKTFKDKCLLLALQSHRKNSNVSNGLGGI